MVGGSVGLLECYPGLVGSGSLALVGSLFGIVGRVGWTSGFVGFGARLRGWLPGVSPAATGATTAPSTLRGGLGLGLCFAVWAGVWCCGDRGLGSGSADCRHKGSEEFRESGFRTSSALVAAGFDCRSFE